MLVLVSWHLTNWSLTIRCGKTATTTPPPHPKPPPPPGVSDTWRSWAGCCLGNKLANERRPKKYSGAMVTKSSGTHVGGRKRNTKEARKTVGLKAWMGKRHTWSSIRPSLHPQCFHTSFFLLVPLTTIHYSHCPRGGHSNNQLSLKVYIGPLYMYTYTYTYIYIYNYFTFHGFTCCPFVFPSRMSIRSKTFSSEKNPFFFFSFCAN